MLQEELDKMLELLDLQREWTEQEMVLAVIQKNSSEIDTLLKTQSKLDDWVDAIQDIIIDIRLANPDEEWVDDNDYIRFLNEIDDLEF